CVLTAVAGLGALLQGCSEEKPELAAEKTATSAPVGATTPPGGVISADAYGGPVAAAPASPAKSEAQAPKDRMVVTDGAVRHGMTGYGGAMMSRMMMPGMTGPTSAGAAAPEGLLPQARRKRRNLLGQPSPETETTQLSVTPNTEAYDRIEDNPF